MMIHLRSFLTVATGLMLYAIAAAQPFQRPEPPKQTHQLTLGNCTLGIDADRGGKILSFQCDGKEIISQSKWPESFGSTFWTSPQKEWNWPPVKEFDKGKYTVEQVSTSRIVMTSEVSEQLKYRVIKEICADASKHAFVVTYSIINESGETRQVAPWEITRVNNEGVIFFDADINAITPANLMPLKSECGVVWCTPDEKGENRKINADGKGWLAYSANGLLLVKTFDDLQPSQPAPGEAEIQVYINRGKTYIELESQGAYTTLKPGEELSWTVRWYLAPTKYEPKASKKLLKQVKKLIK